MLDYWLRKSDVKPSWEDVAKALRKIKLYQLADSIHSAAGRYIGHRFNFSLYYITIIYVYSAHIYVNAEYLIMKY